MPNSAPLPFSVRLTDIKKLKDDRQYDRAREAAEAIWDADEATLSVDEKRFLGQIWAQAYYQDESLRKDEARESALGILNRADPLKDSIDPETLGIAGAIYKRSWQQGAQRIDLDLAGNYYLKAASVCEIPGGYRDRGYAAINAALFLDLRASEEEKGMVEEGVASEAAVKSRKRAEELRKGLVTMLGPTSADLLRAFPDAEWWNFATLGEALFGLGRYGEARDVLQDGLDLKPTDRLMDSTSRQLAVLACLKGFGGTAPELEQARMRAVLKDLFGVVGDPAAILRGKVGLALSGGGFRASFFHIGVLARLAEVDALRHVETLSCVSGGSILGAYYYLKVQKLLEENPDERLGQPEYLKLVQELEADFLKSVQKNLRVRAARNLFKNLKMTFSKTYSRTHRTAELMDDLLFNERQVPRSKLRVQEKGPRTMDQLLIYPNGDTNFYPDRDNWRRNNKVPVLVINATSLNTCHQWQFTASWMGEPPEGASRKIDGNSRLRRMYYHEAPDPYKKVKLSFAVGASAAVPGVFEPLPMTNLYPEIVVRLADGGVYDNQGTASLIDQDCNVLLISDASGHQGEELKPAADILGNLFRANSVSLSRVREAQYLDLAARKRSALTRGMMYVHLRQDLQPGERAWIGSKDISMAPPAPESLTSYGIQREMQDLIARVRTDLDSFSDIEAAAISFSGYKMAEEALREMADQFHPPANPAVWRFLEIQEALQKPQSADLPRVREVLKVASKVPFKVWYLNPVLRVLRIVIFALLAVGILAIAFYIPDRDLFHLSQASVAKSLVGMAVVAVGGKLAVEAVNWKGFVQRFLLGVFLSTIGCVLANLHLWFFEWMFLRAGRLNRQVKQ